MFSGRRPACDLDAMPPAYAALLQQCWATNPAERPSFAEIIPRVRDMIRDERAKRAAAADGPTVTPAGGAPAPPPSRDGSAPATGGSTITGITVRDAAHALHQGGAQPAAAPPGAAAPGPPVPHSGPGRPAGVGLGVTSGAEPRADPDAVTMAAASPIFVEPERGATGATAQAPQSPFSVEIARRSVGLGVDGQGKG